MIEIRIRLDSNKIVESLEATGHSLFDKPGKDIVCSAVTILLETAVQSLIKLPSVIMDKSDSGEIYRVKLKKYADDLTGEVRGITIYLITGLKILSGCYDKQVKLTIVE